MKKALHIVAWIIGLLAVLLLAGLVAVQSPRVQTWLGQKVIEKLRGDSDARIRFSRIAVRPFDAVVLHDFLIEDPSPVIEGMDTLVYVRNLSAKFSLRGLLNGGSVYVNRIKVEDGCFNYGIEVDSLAPDGSSANYRRIFNLPYSDPDSPDESHWGKLLTASDVQVKDFSFRYCSQTGLKRRADNGEIHVPPSIDWYDFTIDVGYVKASKVEIADDMIKGIVDQLQASERTSGFRILDASARKVEVGKGKAAISGVWIKEQDTDLHARYLILDGTLDDYDDFENRVRMEGLFEPGSYLSMQTLRFFASSLEKYTFRGYLQGIVEGPVNNLHLKGINIEDMDNGVRVKVDGSIVGLPEPMDTRLNLDVKELSFALDGVDGFITAWAPATRLDLDSYAPGKRFLFTGQLTGLIDKMKIQGDIDSELGDIGLNLGIRNVLQDRAPIVIGGQLNTVNLDAGKLAGTDALGPVTLRTGIEAELGNETNVRIDSLIVDRLRALDYDYSGISAVGNYSDDAFNGRIISSDPNLNFLFQGLFNLSPNTKNAAYQFFVSLGYADLHALHLDSREQSKISLQATSNFLRTGKGDLLGDIVVSNINLESSSGNHQLGDLSVKAHANDDLHRIRVQSDYLEASYVGNRTIGTFANDIKNLILDRDLPALTSERARPWDGGTYELNFKVGAAQDLLTFIVPGLWVENRTAGKLNVDDSGLVTASVTSGRLAYYDKYIKDFRLDFNNGEEVLQATITGSTISLSGTQLAANRLTLFADDNRFGMGYTFDNEEESSTKAELFLNGNLEKEADGFSVVARALPSNLYYKGNGWGLSSGDISYRKGHLHIDQLQARHEDEMLLINGGYSPDRTDTLRVRMDKFDIGLMNSFMGDLPPLEGKATGRAVIISPSEPMPGLLASITCDSTRISGHPAGRIQLASNWDEENQRFNMFVRNRLNDQRNINLTGYFVPSSNALHAEASLNRFNLGYTEDLLSGLFSHFEGGLSGKVGVDGTLDKLHLSSENLRIEDGTLELDYLRVPYQMEGPLELNDKGLYFKDVRLSDGNNGTGKITGGLLFNNFKETGLDTHVRLNRMHVLNLQPGMNSTLYGSAFGSGRVDVTGTLSDILLKVDASISDPSTLHILTDFGGDDSSSQLLTFTEPPSYVEEDAYEKMLAASQQSASTSSNTNIELRIRATPELELYLDMEENSLNAQGNGTVDLTTNLKDGGFSMNGDYTLTGGNFHFSVMNLVKRDFIIQDGSSVRFNGSVMNTDLNVKGVYVTKASLSTLLSDETTSSRRTVNCGIDITGKLSNPEVDFSIDVPDLNPSTQAQVESMLNTQDKVQKQFVYLLLASNFLPGEDSGISASGSDMLFSNVSSIMSGQLNTIFQRLNIPLDLGLNYQSTQAGSNLFDVALSTQLFNNRVLVNGTVGNKELIGGTTTNEIAGDMDIEIKLNRSGTLRLSAFTHSADQFTYFLDNSQRHGAGIAYQRNFNSFRQFFRELFSSRRQREEWAETEARQQRNIVLQIDSTGVSTVHYDE